MIDDVKYKYRNVDQRRHNSDIQSLVDEAVVVTVQLCSGELHKEAERNVDMFIQEQ